GKRCSNNRIYASPKCLCILDLIRPKVSKFHFYKKDLNLPSYLDFLELIPRIHRAFRVEKSSKRLPDRAMNYLFHLFQNKADFSAKPISHCLPKVETET